MFRLGQISVTMQGPSDRPLHATFIFEATACLHLILQVFNVCPFVIKELVKGQHHPMTEKVLGVYGETAPGLFSSSGTIQI